MTFPTFIAPARAAYIQSQVLFSKLIKTVEKLSFKGLLPMKSGTDHFI
jgi:hypothetical protein